MQSPWKFNVGDRFIGQDIELRKSRSKKTAYMFGLEGSILTVTKRDRLDGEPAYCVSDGTNLYLIREDKLEVMNLYIEM